MTAPLPLYLLPALFRSPPPTLYVPPPAPALGGAMGLQGQDHAPTGTRNRHRAGRLKEATGGSSPTEVDRGEFP